jgi:dephospho-CoA kinase
MRVGLTGGIGSGKSTVAAMFAELGAAVVDSDAIARSLTAPGGAAVAAIREAFGADVIDAHGALDRPRMRARVLADPAQRLRLEAILHPLIGERCVERARQHEAHAKLVLIDVPLLTETPVWRDRLELDRILVIDCPVALQRERALRRGTLSPEEVDAIIAVQAPRSARLEIADDVIVNVDSLDELRQRVARLWLQYEAAKPL